MVTDIEIFPRALVNAAKTFAHSPKVVGEVMVALVDGHIKTEAKLTELQRYILAECREEIAERAARRERVAERKRRQRSRAKDGAEHNTNKEYDNEEHDA